MQPLLTAFYRLFVPTDISLPKINEFILYFARLAHFTAVAVKLGFVSAIKINEFILYFARLALTLHHTLLIRLYIERRF